MGKKDSDVNYWFNSILEGLFSLRQGYRVDAWKSFNKGCERFWKRLSFQPVDLVLDLVRIFCFYDWQSCPDFKRGILKFFSSIAKLQLWLEHPLVKFLQWLLDDSVATHGRREMRALIGDILVQSSWCDREAFLDSYSQVWIFNDGENASENVFHLSQLLVRANSVFGPQHRITIWMMYDLSRALMNAGELLKARSNLLEMLGLRADGLADDINYLGLHHSIDPVLQYRALSCLSEINWKLDEYQKCLACDRKCFESVIANNLGKTEAVARFEDLQESLIKTGNWAELARLRDEYPDLHQKLPDRLRLLEIPPDGLTLDNSSGFEEHRRNRLMELENNKQPSGGRRGSEYIVQFGYHCQEGLHS
jgi:hypothetical protein